MIASMGLKTGMRRGEMLALRWRDVDLDGARVAVEQSLEQTGGHGVRAKSPKTKAGRRTIELPGDLVTELREHWRAQQEQRLALGLGRAADDSTVLQDFEGRPLIPDTVSKQWERLKSGATLHGLRHTHASILIASGMDLLTISRRLGHSSPTITLTVYGHLISGTDARAARVMEAAFG
jgi:integrase